MRSFRSGGRRNRPRDGRNLILRYLSELAFHCTHIPSIHGAVNTKENRVLLEETSGLHSGSPFEREEAKRKMKKNAGESCVGRRRSSRSASRARRRLGGRPRARRAGVRRRRSSSSTAPAARTLRRCPRRTRRLAPQGSLSRERFNDWPGVSPRLSFHSTDRS